MILLLTALLRALSVGQTEAFTPPLQLTYSKQLCFAADHCHYSCSSRCDSLLQLGAVSERAQTNEKVNETPAITTSPDETDSLQTSTGQPHSLNILAGSRVQSTSLSKDEEEQELWQELLTSDENLGHIDSKKNVIQSEQEEIANDETASNQNDEECVSCNSSVEESGKESASSDEPEDATVSDVRASLARSAILRRAGVAGGKTRQSSRSNGRSSFAKTHVNKGTRSANKGSAVGQVLSTVRTAAAGDAGKKNNAAETKDGSGNSNKDLRACDAFNVNKPVPMTPKLNDAIISAVSEVLAQPTADELLQPPPGMTSMGLLGEVVHEDFPVIPPLPGKFLTEYQARRNSPLISIRSSMPHSPDDTHIANLRLSVFSNFDCEKQRAFRHRSVEVINIRRRRGAVVLVAETPVEEEENQNYLNEMQARIARGHTFGEKSSDSVNVVTISKQQQHRTSRLSSKMIIGSVECSHHEFKGTMLGKSRPKGSLMYVTEVAVRPNKRRNGAGAALMKGVDEVAALRNVETIYLHVDIENKAACAMYERMGYHYLGKCSVVRTCVNPTSYKYLTNKVSCSSQQTNVNLCMHNSLHL